MRTITFQTQIKAFKLENSEQVKTWLAEVLKKFEKDKYNISIVFMSDEDLLKVNKDFLQHDYYTDIVTFDYSSPESIEGELCISLDRVKENAETFSVSFFEELLRVLVHGVLHLLGFKDDSEENKKEMRRKEDEGLEMFHVKHCDK